MQNNSSCKSLDADSGMRQEHPPGILLQKAGKSIAAGPVWGTQEKSGGSVLLVWDARQHSKIAGKIFIARGDVGIKFLADASSSACHGVSLLLIFRAFLFN